MRRGGGDADPDGDETERVGSVDFVHDQLVTGRQLRILNVVDDLTKECLAALVDTSTSGKRAARDPSAFFAMRGEPEIIVSEHGTEFEPARAGLIRLD